MKILCVRPKRMKPVLPETGLNISGGSVSKTIFNFLEHRDRGLRQILNLVTVTYF